MDTVKVRELPQKSTNLSTTDLMIVEDNDGTKIVEIGEFKSLLQKGFYFNTIEDMKTATLQEGDVVHTLGYRSANDGGGAWYEIVYAPTDLDDGVFTHYLYTSDTLRAHLINDGKINILQAGAFGDGVNDDYYFINKALNSGYKIDFPAKTYKLSGPLDIPSDYTLDLNGATLLCNTSSCICLGLNKDTSDITIKDGIFQGKYGIEVYAYARNITIENCSFKAISNSIAMDKAIVLNGTNDITISGCDIGEVDTKVSYGITLSDATKGVTTYGNSNVLISSCKMIVNNFGIYTTSTYKDKNILINGCIIQGFGSDRNQITAIGIQIGSVSDSISISSCAFSRLDRAFVISGTVDTTVALTDITCDDVKTMYNLLSDSGTVYLSGMQKFTGASDRSAANKSAIFAKMTGTLHLNTSIDCPEVGVNTSIVQSSVNMVGDLIDSVHPTSRNKITISSANDFNSNINNAIPAYMNVSIDLNYAGNISTIPFPSLSGQLIALYSSSSAKLISGSKIVCGQDITLNRYTPVILKNISGVWTRVG